MTVELPDTLDLAVRQATATLAAAGVETPRRDAVLLAAHAAGVGPGEVERLALLRRPTPAGFAELVARRAERVPLQHLTGTAGFRRLELHVGPGVFVPRPETEVAVDLVVEHLRARAGERPADGQAPAGDADPGEAPVVVDLCTGSGAIALAVADEVPSARVHAVELSQDALAYARRNRDRWAPRVDLREGDARAAFDDLVGAVDVVVTNPPYIPPDAVPRDAEVRDHDPAMALYGGGTDGLELPLQLADRAARLLAPGGLFVMEHADVQGEQAVRALAADARWRDVHDVPDLAGRPRHVVARRAAPSPPIDSPA